MKVLQWDDKRMSVDIELTDEFINSGIHAIKPPIDFLDLYIYLLPKHAKEANLIEIALKSMKKDGTQNKILKQ